MWEKKQIEKTDKVILDARAKYCESSLYKKMIYTRDVDEFCNIKMIDLFLILLDAVYKLLLRG